jgi:hypothetical protein
MTSPWLLVLPAPITKVGTIAHVDLLPHPVHFPEVANSYLATRRQLSILGYCFIVKQRKRCIPPIAYSIPVVLSRAEMTPCS